IITTWKHDLDDYNQYRIEHKQHLVEASELRKAISQKKRLIDSLNRDIISCETENNQLKKKHEE
ncbi:hypothetical protein, partial [Pseudomonas sp. 2995-1]|uniref:hypothetical protein n=1 Tax=Pseudomonas sp. 2995-1 TaxID=1712679 RepID=UPI001C44A56C